MKMKILPIIDFTKPRSSTNPLMNPEIPIQSAEHAYNLFKEYYTDAWISKKDSYKRGLDDLKKFSED